MKVRERTYCLECVDGTEFECKSISELKNIIENVLRYLPVNELYYQVCKFKDK